MSDPMSTAEKQRRYRDAMKKNGYVRRMFFFDKRDVQLIHEAKDLVLDQDLNADERIAFALREGLKMFIRERGHVKTED